MIAASPVSCKLQLARSVLASVSSPSASGSSSPPTNVSPLFVPQQLELLGVQCLVRIDDTPLMLPTHAFTRIHDDFSVSFEAPLSGSVTVKMTVTLYMTGTDYGPGDVYQALVEPDGDIVPQSVRRVSSTWWQNKLTTEYVAEIGNLVPCMTYTWFPSHACSGSCAAYMLMDSYHNTNFPCIEVWG